MTENSKDDLIPKPEIRMLGFTKLIDSISEDASLYGMVNEGAGRERMQPLTTDQGRGASQNLETSVWPPEHMLALDNARYNPMSKVFSVNISNRSEKQIKVISAGVNYDIDGNIMFAPQNITLEPGRSENVRVSCSRSPVKFVLRTADLRATGLQRPPADWER